MDDVKKRIVKPNYTQVPNAVLDDMMSEMSESELRVVLAVCRKTFGWQKTRDKISISQIEKLTGLSRQAVVNGIRQAIARGIVERESEGQSFTYEIAVFDDDETSQRSRLELVNVVDTQKKVLKEKKEIPPSAEKTPKTQPCGHSIESIASTDEGTNYCRECAAMTEFDAMPSASAIPSVPTHSRSAEVADPRANRAKHVDRIADELRLLVGSEHKIKVAAKKLLLDYNNPDGIIRAIQFLRADDSQRAFAERAGAMAMINPILTAAKRRNGGGSSEDLTAQFFAEVLKRG